MSIRNDNATKKTQVQGINKRSSHIARKKRTTGKHLAIKGKLEGTMKKDNLMPRPLHMVAAHWSIQKFLPTTTLPTAIKCTNAHRCPYMKAFTDESGEDSIPLNQKLVVLVNLSDLNLVG